jgi:DNA-binding FrmR family transcriptional regulator
MADCCDHKNNHPDHAGELPRLNRVTGQIDGVKKMIEERRYCPDILTQLRAARAALKNIEAGILEAHLNSCVAEAMESGKKGAVEAKLAEIRDIFKRFDD